VSSSIREQRKTLISDLRNAVHKKYAADACVQEAVLRFANLVDFSISTKGIRRAELISVARLLVLPPVQQALGRVPHIVRMLSKETLPQALDDLEGAYLLVREVDSAANHGFGPLMKMGCETTDLLLEVAHCVFHWPATTTSYESLRTRNVSYGNLFCAMCHRPSEAYAYWHGMDTRMGFFVGMQRTIAHSPERRLSNRYCKIHSKAGNARIANSGRYSAARKIRSRRGKISTDCLRQHLHKCGAAMPSSPRLQAMLEWMLTMPTVARRELNEIAASFPTNRGHLQQIVHRVLRPAFGCDLLEIEENLLELNIHQDGEVQRIFADGSATSQKLQKGNLETAIPLHIDSLRKQIPIGRKAPAAAAWSDEFGIEIIVFGDHQVRLVLTSPTWLARALRIGVQDWRPHSSPPCGS
jgi:hypothetical protein